MHCITIIYVIVIQCILYTLSVLLTYIWYSAIRNTLICNALICNALIRKALICNTLICNATCIQYTNLQCTNMQCTNTWTNTQYTNTQCTNTQCTNIQCTNTGNQDSLSYVIISSKECISAHTVHLITSFSVVDLNSASNDRVVPSFLDLPLPSCKYVSNSIQLCRIMCRCHIGCIWLLMFM